VARGRRDGTSAAIAGEGKESLTMTTKTTTTKKSNRMIRYALALTFGAALGACEDLPPPTRHVSPPVSATTPPAPTTPTPVQPPPAPVATPEPSQAPDAIAKIEEEPKPLDPCGLARKLLDEGEVGKALLQAQLAVDETPKRSAAWNVLGRAQLRSGKRGAAIESFEKAALLNPRNIYAHNNLGLALIYDKQYEEAVAALEEAVSLDHVEGYMWNNLGMAYEQLDRLDEARDAYTKAADLASDRARDSLARLKGVESVMQTAKVEVQIDEKERGPVTQ
jgi:predicted negative regulator of RcsB-dependent stress response